jgi:YHS domain-containing protein
MKAKVVLLSLIVLSVCLISVAAQAQEQNKKPMMNQMPKQSGQAMNVGNMICPVDGIKMGDMGAGMQYEYKGKVYNFCCAACLEAFKKDPEKYVKIVDQEMKQNKMMGKDGQQMNMPMSSDNGMKK